VHLALDRLVAPQLAGHLAESRAFYAARGQRRGPSSLQELRAARAQHPSAPLPAGGTVEHVVGASGQRIGAPEGAGAGHHHHDNCRNGS